MKGFRESGRAGGSSKGDAGEARRGETLAGEAARLRKGLFEERLILRPADGGPESRSGAREAVSWGRETRTGA